MESSHQNINNRTRPRIKRPDNSHVPLAQSVAKRMGVPTSKDLEISPELHLFVAMILGDEIHERSIEVLQNIAKTGRDEPNQYVSIIDSQIEELFATRRMLDTGAREEFVECSKQIVYNLIAHIALYSCWYEKLEEGTGNWKAAHERD